MVDPFTLSYIIISSTLHICHIGYAIYKNCSIIKKEIVKIEEDIIDIVKHPNHLIQDIEKINVEINKTIEIINNN